jgi:hypothetical protein
MCVQGYPENIMFQNATLICKISLLNTLIKDHDHVQYHVLGFFRTKPAVRVLRLFVDSVIGVGSIFCFFLTKPVSRVFAVSWGSGRVAVDVDGFRFFRTPITVVTGVAQLEAPAEWTTGSFFPVTDQPQVSTPPRTAISSFHRFVALAVDA